MTRLLGILIAASLAGCSGVSTVCDRANRCLEVWRSVTAASSVTHAEMIDHGRPDVNHGLTVAGSGWLSDVDPMASATSDMKAARTW